MVIWTPYELINKFEDLDAHFESLRIGMTPTTKLKGPRCILLFSICLLIHQWGAFPCGYRI